MTTRYTTRSWPAHWVPPQSAPAKDRRVAVARTMQSHGCHYFWGPVEHNPGYAVGFARLRRFAVACAGPAVQVAWGLIRLVFGR